MAIVRFSIPMIAEIDDNHPVYAAAAPFLTEQTLANLLSASVACLPEFDEFLATANDGATWCVASLDTSVIV